MTQNTYDPDFAPQSPSPTGGWAPAGDVPAPQDHRAGWEVSPQQTTQETPAREKVGDVTPAREKVGDVTEDPAPSTHDAQDAPLPDDLTVFEEPAVDDVVEVPPDVEPDDDLPPTDDSNLVRDPETYQANRERFERGDVPSADYEEILLIKEGKLLTTEGLALLEARMGTEEFLKDVMIPGSRINTLYRFIFDLYDESYRMQALFEKLPKDVRDKLTTTWIDPKNPKKQLRAYDAREPVSVGNTVVDGDDAYVRMVSMAGGRGRFLLYESNIGLEMIVPQNSDFDTLFTMLAQDELAQFMDVGLEVFDISTYRLREITFEWARPYITRCSLMNWQKPGILEKALTITDFNAILVYLAQLTYPDGFDRFVDRCTRPISADYPDGCAHTKRITIKPSDLVVPRFACMTEEQLANMQDRLALKQNTLAQVSSYKALFSFGHVVLQHREWSITLDIPTLERYFETGRAAFAATQSVIQSGDVASVIQDVASKGFRSLSIYVSAITQTHDNRSLTTHNPIEIMKLLGRICDQDEKLCDPDDLDQWLVKKIQDFIESCQITFVGYQTKPCPACGYVNPNTDGWAGVDPLRLFFTIGRSLR